MSYIPMKTEKKFKLPNAEKNGIKVHEYKRVSFEKRILFEVH